MYQSKAGFGGRLQTCTSFYFDSRDNTNLSDITTGLTFGPLMCYIPLRKARVHLWLCGTPRTPSVKQVMTPEILGGKKLRGEGGLDCTQRLSRRIERASPRIIRFWSVFIYQYELYVAHTMTPLERSFWSHTHAQRVRKEGTVTGKRAGGGAMQENRPNIDRGKEKNGRRKRKCVPSVAFFISGSRDGSYHWYPMGRIQTSNMIKIVCQGRAARLVVCNLVNNTHNKRGCTIDVPSLYALRYTRTTSRRLHLGYLETSWPPTRLVASAFILVSPMETGYFLFSLSTMCIS